MSCVGSSCGGGGYSGGNPGIRQSTLPMPTSTSTTKYIKWDLENFEKLDISKFISKPELHRILRKLEQGLKIYDYVQGAILVLLIVLYSYASEIVDKDVVGVFCFMVFALSFCWMQGQYENKRITHQEEINKIIDNKIVTIYIEISDKYQCWFLRIELVGDRKEKLLETENSISTSKDAPYKELTVNVVRLTEGNIRIQLLWSNTIFELKDKISQSTFLSSKFINLLYKDKVLDNGKTMHSYNIQDNDQIEMILACNSS